MSAKNPTSLSDLGEEIREALQRGDEAAARRLTAVLMGRARTDRKIAAAQQNGTLGGRKQRPLSDYPCTCGAGESMEPSDHHRDCPRGRCLRWRAQDARPERKEAKAKLRQERATEGQA